MGGVAAGRDFLAKMKVGDEKRGEKNKENLDTSIRIRASV